MATTLSRNLKLKINSNLTAEAKYNLEAIDALGGVYSLDSSDTVNIRSKEDINILPHDASTGGSGTGGTVNIGSLSQLVTLNLFASVVNAPAGIRLKDEATSGTGYLKLRYKTDISGGLDTTDRTLSFDMEGGDRQLLLAGNLSVLSGNLTITAQVGGSAVTMPSTGTLATLAGVEILTNKVIDAAANTLSNIANASVATGAGIIYSKLALTGSILNSDISNSAAIAYSKLNLANSITNADIVSNAAIPYSKLSLTGGILDADVSVSAAIAGTKVAPNFGSQNIQTSGSLKLSNGSFQTSIAASGSQASNLTITLPATAGTAGQLLETNGAGGLSWTSISGVSGQTMSQAWVSGDGVTKTITHGWNTRKLVAQILDIDNGYASISIDSETRIDNNNIQLTASEAPSGSGWLVLLQEVLN